MIGPGRGPLHSQCVQREANKVGEGMGVARRLQRNLRTRRGEAKEDVAVPALENSDDRAWLDRRIFLPQRYLM